MIYAYEDAAIMWRGFQQAWVGAERGYQHLVNDDNAANHRLNRLGDYINGDFDCSTSFPYPQLELMYTAASGTLADTAAYATYYTKLGGDGIGFQIESVLFEISGDEHYLNPWGDTIEIEPEWNTGNRDRYAVVLNGFDLCAMDDADKLESLYIGVDNARYEEGKIKFELTVLFQADCDSVECDPGDGEISYKFRVNYLVIAGDEDDFIAFSNYEEKNYDWDIDDELYLQPMPCLIDRIGGNQYEEAALGFSSIYFDLHAQEHWMLEWVSAIQPGNYNKATGDYDYDLELMFKQWTDPLYTWSSKKAGEATVGAGVIMLQFKDAYVSHGELEDEIYWPADGDGSCGDVESENVNYVSVSSRDEDCDGWFDTIDNCPAIYNPGQQDRNHNGIGDVCEIPDLKVDLVSIEVDNYGSESSHKYKVTMVVDIGNTGYTDCGEFGVKWSGAPVYDSDREVEEGSSYQFINNFPQTKTGTVAGLTQGDTIELSNSWLVDKDWYEGLRRGNVCGIFVLRCEVYYTEEIDEIYEDNNSDSYIIIGKCFHDIKNLWDELRFDPTMAGFMEPDWWDLIEDSVQDKWPEIKKLYP